MEPKLGYAFRRAPVHDGAGVRAATPGRDVTFGTGKYAPTANHGIPLIAHESAYVVQQSQNIRSSPHALERPIAAEVARRKTQRHLRAQSWEMFIWQYSTPRQMQGFNAVNIPLFVLSKTTVARNLDYDGWSHLAIFSLLEKKKAEMTWPDPIRRYNGSGARARYDPNTVLRRADGQWAARTGVD